MQWSHAYRSTYPGELRGRSYDLIVGEMNNNAVESAIPGGSRVLLGWGALEWEKLPGGRTRRDDMLSYLAHVEATPLCLGITASGEPRHPLYVRGDAPFVEFSARRAS